MKVLFLQTAHLTNDDRVYYHQRVCLEQAGHNCFFASDASEITTRPDVIICDTPVAIWRARKLFGRIVPIVYDVTEWYPSKKNLRKTNFLYKPFKFCLLILANYWAGCSANAFLFGEYHKSLPFRFFFPKKRYMYLPYYPSLHYIHSTAPKPLSQEIRLFYAGLQTEEKGYKRVERLVRLCEQKMPDKHFIFTSVNGITYEDFCQEITRHDIFLDLRDADIENTRCLPIKLFYYIAAGRPVIYSDLKAIRHGVPEIFQDSLVQPDDLESAAEMICNYTLHPDYYLQICARNRQLAESKYNWESLCEAFVQFMEKK